MRKNILKINKGLTYTFSAVLALNVLVLGAYTVITNIKVSEALEIIKPQTASITIISEKSCEECRTMEALERNITAQNVEITDRKELSADQDEAKDFLEEYEITKLPALIFTADTRINNSLQKAFEKNSTVISDKVILWEQRFPPFYDLASKETQGQIDVIYLSDKSCEECYDPAEIFAGVFKNFGISVNDGEIVDLTDPEGTELVKKYDIKDVPTVILSEDTALYGEFASVWAGVGSVEEDGKYVFRKMESIKQTSRNLETGEITKP
ncbi:hypothetical protein CO046_03720 [Candidatus Peregrinibacteria bacterium CG_4_9_14_0_2_um_filter_53_11]|nr:MAG: hypothetical protein CO046_03720 [Candidatus Peregrinibacteria bacterium CG_4_9_14_0_2_um_filter_53_11]